MKRFTKRKIVFGAAALLLLCCLGVMVTSFLSPDDPEVDVTAVAGVGEVAAEETATLEISPTAMARPAKTAVLSTDIPAPVDTAVPTSTAEPVMATEISQPTAVPGEIASGGLGLSRQEWELAHEWLGEGIGSSQTYTNGYAVYFCDDRVWQLEQEYALDGLPLSEARVFAGTLIPVDSEFIKTYSPDGLPELTVDLYLSESLAQLFDPNLFTEAEPGNFIVIFGDYEQDGRVTRMVIGLGDNP
ncbi:MAG: hypothetical protein IT327_07950 [Anaerolineae bacterium]|nr:hypothetical protein [Anaerolineae bacterium]